MYPRTCQGNACYHILSNVLERRINLVYLALVYATNKHTVELEREPSCSIVSQLAAIPAVSEVFLNLYTEVK